MAVASTKIRIVAIGAVSLVLTLAFSARYGALNQTTYLLDPLQQAVPGLFHRDWFVHDTPAYLPVFGWFAKWLFVLDPDGTVAVIAANAVITLATYAAMYWLARGLDDSGRTFVIVASFVTLTRGLSIGGSYVLAGYLQPSTISTLGWVVALAALAADRFLIAGIAAAVAGLFHANFLVLGIGLFGLTLVARWDVRFRDWVRVMAPQLVVLVCFLPQLIAAAGPSEHAVWILTHFHAPGHYAPHRLASWIKELAAWHIGAFAALQLLRGVAAARVLWRFSLVAFCIVVGSTLVIRYTPFVSLTQARWSRIAPFGQLACQVLVVGAVVRQARHPVALAAWKRGLVLVGLLVPLYESGRYLRTVISWPAIVCAMALVATCAVAMRERVTRVVLDALVVAAVAYALWRSPRGEGLTTTPAVGSPDELALYRWIRANTPVSALFVAPPSLYGFRLQTRRAMVVDSKSPPLQPVLLEQWYRRMTDLVLVPDAPTYQAVEARYWELTWPQLVQVAAAFHADYVVTGAGTVVPQPPLYANGQFAVYSLAATNDQR